MYATRMLTLLLIFVSFSVGAESKLPEPSVTLHIQMRDGTTLPTDIYLPPNQAKNLPCILIRSPTGRQAHMEHFIPLTQAGYAVAIQGTRNTIDLEGKTFPCVHDGWGTLQDGYDTVRFLAEETDITNGKIGTIGFSAMGIMQLLMAPTAPEALKCQYISVAPASLYHHAMYQGGQLLKHQVEGWIGYCAKHPSVLNHATSQERYNDFWESLDTTKVAGKVKAPAIHIGGWFDIFQQGTIDAFLSRQEKGGEGARGKQKLVMGPWGHYWPQSDAIGDFKVPEQGRQPPSDISPLRWFNHYLMGENSKVDDIPAVQYYVMGPLDGSSSSGNVWRAAHSWPIPARETALYLDSRHSLQLQKDRQTHTISFSYDPNSPVPTVGGRNLFLESGPKDQRPLENRKDVVTFTTEPLKEDVEITGRILSKIWLSTDAEDTDLSVRLCDVYPDGRSILITDGMCRLSSIDDLDGEDLNEPHEIEVDLWSTSLVFAKGHKIRLSITSSNYPRFEKNLNRRNKEEIATAGNVIHMGNEYPSKVILPIASSNTFQFEEDH